MSPSSWEVLVLLTSLGAQLGHFKGRGCVLEMGLQGIGFPRETFKAVESQVEPWRD